MKKSLLSFSAALLSLAAIAQPSITATGVNPVVGDAYVSISNTTAISPGSAGANQTWTIPSITGSTTTATYVTPGSTPNGSMFSGTNLALSNNGTYAYYTSSSSALQFNGSSSGGVNSVYQNPEDMMHYPCNYNSTFTDAYASTFTNTTTFYLTGTHTVTADGYGTLTTPAGTFSNVMRIHMHDSYKDSANLSGFPFVSTAVGDQYLWFANGYHYPLATISSYTTNTNGSVNTSGSSGYAQGAVGIQAVSGIAAGVTLFPNPASSDLQVSVDVASQQTLSIKLFNSLGMQMGSAVNTTATPGSNAYHLNINDLPAGPYFAQVCVDGVPVVTRRFVISR